MAKFKFTQSANRERATKALKRLRKAHPDAGCSLEHVDPLQLMVSTILSAQCTDVRVNIVTQSLFKKYKTVKDYSVARIGELEAIIRTCGFYRQKAKNIRAACRKIIEDFDGEVPRTMEELLTLDGVGRKTANIVLGDCFDTPGVVVDTHCKRIANRLGFTRSDNPARIEQDLMKIWEEKHWALYSHCLVFHGRRVCPARAPRCSGCTLADLCPFPGTAEGRRIAR